MRARKKTTKTEPVRRHDGWQNALTGVGTALRDKRRGNTFAVDDCGLDRQSLENLWEGDDMAARIIEIPPGEMMRNGFDLKITDGDPDGKEPGEGDDTESLPMMDAFGASAGALIPAPPTKPPGVIEPKDEDTKETADALMARYKELGGPEKFKRGLQYRRAYGGGALLLGVDDGQSPDKPLNFDNIKSFKWMNVLTERELQAVQYYGDPYAEKYGEPEIFQITATVDQSVDMASVIGKTKAKKNRPAIAYVHESRLIIFPGIFVSDQHRQRRRGWGNSIMVRVLSVLADFQMTYGGAAHLTTDMAQAVFKIKGLAEMMAMGADDKMVARAQLIDISRSLARCVVIDQDEEFERKQTPINGLPELLERFEHRLAAAADMPVSLLMGSSPAGLNATGDADIRFWYDHMKTAQIEDLQPRLEYFFRVLMHTKDGPTKGVEPDDWTIKFRPLWQNTDTEIATIRKTQSETDVNYINAGVLTPEEVAASRFAGAEYSMETTIDMEGRAKMAEEHVAATEEHAQKMAELTPALLPPKTPPAGK